MPQKIGLVAAGAAGPELAGELLIEGREYMVVIYRDGEPETYTGWLTPQVGGAPGSRAQGGAVGSVT